MALAAALLVAALAVGILLRRISQPHTQPTFQERTFRRGTIDTARFAPDGQTIVYSAIWEDEPTEVFAVRLESPESRPLDFQGTGHRAANGFSGDLPQRTGRHRPHGLDSSHDS